jgi:hypothetical protein
MKIYIYTFENHIQKILYDIDKSGDLCGMKLLGTCECEISGRHSTYIKDEDNINVGDVIYVNSNILKKKQKYLLINSITLIK